MKYIAVKVRGIEHWFWFERKKVKRADGKFEGKEGWGEAGAFSNLSVTEELIEGEIESEKLQYKN